jgi:uncharacterized protein (UPF0332 family)
MSSEVAELWGRALKTLGTARRIAEDDPDTSAACVYYAAFYAVSALFALRGATFTKDAAVLAAVHRDLVRTGEFSKEFGADFQWLAKLRDVGSYGGAQHATPEETQQAIERADRIIRDVNRVAPQMSTSED